MDLKNINELRDDHSEIKKEPEQLFQDSWFFGNLLQTSSNMSSSCSNKPKSMLRSFSDPYTSTSSSSCGDREIILTADKSYEEAYRSIKKLEEFENPGLKKAPSMTSRRNIKSKLKSSNALLRAPSLPASLESVDDEEFQDEEIEFSLGKLIRQASMKTSSTSDELSPRRHGAKALTTASSSMSRQRSMRKHEVDIIKMEGSEDAVPQVPMKQLQPQKSLTTSLKSEELQGFKDLGFQFEKMDLNNPPNVVSSVSPNFREKGRTEEKNVRRSYHTYEAWRSGHSSAPPVPKRGGKRSTSNDVMKEQIRFWARAVASNVRQEC